jgi:hypothetical protein
LLYFAGVDLRQATLPRSRRSSRAMPAAVAAGAARALVRRRHRIARGCAREAGSRA